MLLYFIIILLHQRARSFVSKMAINNNILAAVIIYGHINVWHC